MRWKRFLLVVIDAALINLAVVAALLLRFDGHPPGMYVQLYALVAPFHTLLVLLALELWKINRSLWRYAGIPTALSLLQALTLVHALLFVANLFVRPHAFPRSVIILSFLISLVLIGGSRILLRLYRSGRPRLGRRSGTRILIAGAGDVGALVAREIQRGQNGMGYAVGFVDDEPSKRGRRIENLEVLGTAFDIPRLIREQQIDEIVVAAPSAPSRLIRQIHEHGLSAGIRVRTVPPLADFIEGKGALRQLREVSIEDLLGRDPVKIDQERVRDFLTGKRILVTGAGGSIGSELCRQIARFRPARLIALDHDENRLTYLGIELSRTTPTLDLLLIVGDIKDSTGIRDLTRLQRPQVIFHAAAHKHVSLLETRPREAIRNNIHGTLNVARAAQACRADALVLISTDKAVDPTNVMGASKRVCELIGQALSRTEGEPGGTIFTAVRFGNVMGSEGSVIPIFRRQIAEGGPVTVTHPQARRYFMTVAEASQLVLQAASFGSSGDVFILDMGEQVRILDVARELIRLSGLEPDEDVPIVFTGLRPGEKLEEEILTGRERVRTTRHAKVFRCNLEPLSPRDVLKEIEELISAAESEPAEQLKKRLQGLVPEFRLEAEPPPLPGVFPIPMAGDAAATGNGRTAGQGPAHTSQGTPLADRIVAALMLGTIGLPLGIALCLRRWLGPSDVHLAREVRIGRDRRAGDRRTRGGWAPIDRRFTDRRRRNLGGMPYAAYRIKFRGDPRSAFWRRADRMLQALGSEALPGFVNVLRGVAALSDLYPGELAPEHGDHPVFRTGSGRSAYPRDVYRNPSLTGTRRGEAE